MTLVDKNTSNNTAYSVQEAQSSDETVFNGIAFKVSL